MTATDSFTSKTSSSKKTQFSHFSFEEKIANFSQALLQKFKSFTRFYALFHITFISLAILQILSVLLFFSFFTKSTWAALALATVFLTGFSYFVLLFYFQAKKPQQFIELRDSFYTSCQEHTPFEKGSHEYHLSLSHALTQCSALLDKQESSYYGLARNFKTLGPLLEKFSIWVHWKDIHKMKEQLLLISIEENIALVKAMPTDLEAHACLANAYLALSRLYLDPRKAEPHAHYPWVSPEYASAAMKEKFQTTSERATEEFKILNDYAPHDPWVHAQLAHIYHDRQRPQEEIQEYETLLKIIPHDHEILFRLGVLYFQQGFNAKGLRIYEELKKNKAKKGDELISYYDAFHFYELSKPTFT